MAYPGQNQLQGQCYLLEHERTSSLKALCLPEIRGLKAPQQVPHPSYHPGPQIHFFTVCRLF